MGMADAVLSPPGVLTKQRVILDGISWATYERLHAGNNPGRGTRFTYDSGMLQIVVLSSRQEWPNRLYFLNARKGVAHPKWVSAIREWVKANR